MLVMDAHKIRNHQYSPGLGGFRALLRIGEDSGRGDQGAGPAHEAELFSPIVSKLRFPYHEKKETPQYILTVAKNGPRLKKSAEDGSEHPGSNMSLSIESGHFVMHSNIATMEAFASQLSSQLRQPVTDATELKGTYDISLSWAFSRMMR